VSARFLGSIMRFGKATLPMPTNTQVGQVFVEAGLADGTDDEVVSFWDAMASMARGQKNDRLSAIGRQGERLTIEHEKGRTGRKPKWVAIDNNEDAYDVLSVVGADDPRSLSIEVKSSTMGLAGRFYLSRNEWERAQETENHAFYLWTMRSNHEPSLAVITPQEMDDHIPIDRGKGDWENVEIPFMAFQQRFATPGWVGDKLPPA